MKCPICRNVEMTAKDLEEGLRVRECGKCGGIWISAGDYWSWLKKQPVAASEKSRQYSTEIEICDSKAMKICPDCGHFLIRRKVGHGLAFYVERCGICGGIWLDRNEWKALREKNIHDEIHQIFSEPWQKAILDEEHRDAYESNARNTLGEADYNKISSLRSWLSEHRMKSFILAYLKGEND